MKSSLLLTLTGYDVTSIKLRQNALPDSYSWINPRLTIYVKNLKSKNSDHVTYLTYHIYDTNDTIETTFSNYSSLGMGYKTTKFQSYSLTCFWAFTKILKREKIKWRQNDVIFRIIPMPFSSQFSFRLDHVSILLLPYLFFQIIREKNNNNNNNPNDFNMSFKKILKAINMYRKYKSLKSLKHFTSLWLVMYSRATDFTGLW